LATSIVFEAQNTNQTFPFVTIKQLSIQIARCMSVTGIIQQASLVPIVNYSQLAEWDTYSAAFNANLQQWASDAIQVQTSSWYSKQHSKTPTNNNSKMQSNGHDESLQVKSVIENWESPRLSVQDIMLPGWQTFPMIYNSDKYRPVGKYYLLL
jgi:hypothetical protein